MTFPLANDAARYRPDDLPGVGRCDEHGHRAAALADGTRGEHRVLERRGRVLVA
jgi:hypothetical protein